MKHRTLQVVVALAGGLVLRLTLAVLVAQTTSVQAAPIVLYVAPGRDCNGASPCYDNIQEAVDAAVTDDEIHVAAGTYTSVSARKGVTQAVYISKTVTIQGGYTITNWLVSDPVANPTTLNAVQSGSVVYITGTIAPVIDGFTLTGGSGTPCYGTHSCGGGVYVGDGSAPMIRNCKILSNTTEYGAGIYIYHSDPHIVATTIMSNTSIGTGSGAGIWMGYTTGATLDNVMISNNRALNSNTGGIYMVHSAPSISRTQIISNVAPVGSALHMYNSPARIDRVIIRGNVTLYNGTVFVFGDATPYIQNSIIADNQVSGANRPGIQVWDSSLVLINNTIANNTGGQGQNLLFHNSTFTMTNNIVFGGVIGIETSGTVTSTFTYNNVSGHSNQDYAGVMYDQTGVNGNISSDPLFVNPASGGYHLRFGSPCIDKGTNVSVTADIDGQSRPMGLDYDIGADEVPLITTVDPITGGTLIYTDTQDNPTIIRVPAEAVTEVITLTYAPIGSVTPTPGFAFANHAFDLEAYQGEALLTSFTFSKAVTITLYYGEADIGGMDENTLVLNYWNGNAWMDAACGIYDRHPVGNWLSVPICHLSRFAVFGEQRKVYLPLVLRNH